METRHPLFRHLLDKGLVTSDELAHVANNGDVVTRRSLMPVDSLYHMPAAAPDFDDSRTVYTSLDPEKQAENREAWEAEQHRLYRSSALPLMDSDGERGYIVDETFKRSDKAVEDEAVGVEFEYRRRSQGRQPWMAPKTYRWVMDLERQRQLKQRQRSAIVGLIRELGADPKAPEVAAWVNEVGYETALAKLQRRRQVAA